MKKLAILAVIVFSFSMTSCKSGKGGCGLTSDAKKVEQTTQQNDLLADASAE